MIELIRLLPLVVAGFALELIYAIRRRVCCGKRRRFLTHVEAVWAYRNRALFICEARLCLCKLRLLRAQFQCFFLYFRRRYILGIKEPVDLSEHVSPEFFREYIHRKDLSVGESNAMSIAKPANDAGRCELIWSWKSPESGLRTGSRSIFHIFIQV